VVYKGEDTCSSVVAIKTILMTSSEEHAGYLARFRQEEGARRAQPPVDHLGYDYGDEGDIAHAMEFLEGRELRDPPGFRDATAVEIVAQVAEGPHCTRAASSTARKPANIMVMDGRRAKIMDFGIARARFRREDGRAMLGRRATCRPSRSSQGIDHRSDIFALGVCSTR
jgi:serine/threonine-protein kinase